MEIAETTETPGGQRARRRLQLRAAPARQTPRGGADSGYRVSAPPCASRAPSLPPAPPQLLPSALSPPHPPGPRSGAVGSPGSELTPPLRVFCCPPRRSAGFWRPWVEDSGEKEAEAPHHAAEAMPDGPGITDAPGKLSRYRHPVRLFWPKSKCYDYLYQEAEALLKKFPIQATISFYEDSDSEEEIEELICEN
ncbi:protein ripply2 [Physeter macrocephalus]|uniref:Protein ripply2 n=1 Tax=Physeter macrocephalus TaxID=9755 RepID=A0A2Y9F4U4_PHYMC|nr:protein ripply2 [Physeter catodon]|eukprot:XP_007115158.2 protein ripply2 [Physeter catodon]